MDNTNNEQPPVLPIIYPEELNKHTLIIQNDNDDVDYIKIIEAQNYHKGNVKNNPADIQFWCSVNVQAYEDIVSYNQTMDYLSRNNYNPVAWKSR